MPLMNILAFVVPALVGAIAAIGLGYRQVRSLREMTGDDSQLTNVMSGEFLRRQRHKEAA